jgi:hypothetical protein
MSNWLSITEYSVRHSISPSTIRRKIKQNSIKFKVENGKYFLFDEYDRPLIRQNDSGDHSSELTQPNVEELLNFAEKSISTVSKLHQDILEEKEKRIKSQELLISQLKEQVGELKMLVNILEKKQ